MEPSEESKRDEHLNKVSNDTISLIEDGYKIIGEEKSENAILILGNTGVGKSCLAAYMSNARLTEKIVNGKKCFELANPEQVPGLKISDGADSETSIPVKLLIKEDNIIKMIIYDLPGFNDSDHHKEIANSFYIQRIFETRGGLKILLVIPDGDFDNRSINFIRNVEFFVRMFKKPEVLSKSITLVVSKIDVSQRKLENIQADIDKLLKSKQSLSPQVRAVITFLSKSIVLFPKPPLPEEYHSLKNPISETVEGETSLNGFEKREYYVPEARSMNVVVSEECKKKVLELFSQRSKDLIGSLTKTAGHIEKMCEQITNDTNKVVKVNSNYNKFLSLFSFFSEKENKIEYKKMLSLNSLVSFRTFIMTVLDESINTQEFLFRFEKQVNPLFDVLKQFFDDPERNELEKLRFVIKERMKHLEFFDQLCDQTILKELVPYRSVFEIAGKAVEEAQKIGVSSFKVDPNNENRDYFLEAIDVMKATEQQLNKSEICSKEKALSYFCLGRLDFNNNKHDDSIDECLHSIKLEPDPILSKDTYNLINMICFRSQNLVQKISGDARIMVQLFNINDKTFDEILNVFQQLIVNFLNRQCNEVKYLLNMQSILENKNMLSNVKTFKQINILQNFIAETYRFTGEEVQITKFQEIFNYLTVICEIYVALDSAKALESLNKWLLKISQIDVEIALFNKIQTFSISKLFEAKAPIEDYKSFIKLSKSETIKNKAGSTVLIDPVISALRIQAYESLGLLYFEMKDFANSLENYLRALEGNPKSENSLRKLDELYFLQLNQFNFDAIPAEIKTSLLNYNITEFIRVFKGLIIVALNDFKMKNNQRNLFRFYDENKDFAMIYYLQDLRIIFGILESITVRKSYEGLSQIYEIFQRQIKENEINQFAQKHTLTICDRIIQNTPKTLLRIDVLIAQYQYLLKLTNNNKDLLKSCFEESPNQLFYGNKESNDQFLEENISGFDLNMEMSNAEYFEKIIDLVKSYGKNMKCMALAAKSYFRLGEIHQNIQLYEQALTFDKLLRDLSKINDESKKFCSKNSKIKNIYDNIADLYTKQGNIGKALEFYEMKGNHYEISRILNEILLKAHRNPAVLEKFADYYKSKGMIDTALNYYHQAYGLIDDEKKMAEIMGKAHSALSSIGEKGVITNTLMERKLIWENGFDVENEGQMVFKDWKI